MARQNLTASRLGVSAAHDGEEDPMASMGNLMDVMLVFACGLILALIANWGVDITSAASVDESTIEPVEAEMEEALDGITLGDSRYSELGSVYRDEETGQLYVLSPPEESP